MGAAPLVAIAALGCFSLSFAPLLVAVAIAVAIAIAVAVALRFFLLRFPLIRFCAVAAGFLSASDVMSKLCAGRAGLVAHLLESLLAHEARRQAALHPVKILDCHRRY